AAIAANWPTDPGPAIGADSRRKASSAATIETTDATPATPIARDSRARPSAVNTTRVIATATPSADFTGRSSHPPSCAQRETPASAAHRDVEQQAEHIGDRRRAEPDGELAQSAHQRGGGGEQSHHGAGEHERDTDENERDDHRVEAR